MIAVRGAVVSRSPHVLAGPFILLLASTVLLLSGCGAESPSPNQGPATITGQVPMVYLPMPDGDLGIQIVPAGVAQADPVATLETSTSESGRFSVEVPPGTYFARVWTGSSSVRSEQFTAVAGQQTTVRFAQR
jgi:hypothetical protein